MMGELSEEPTSRGESELAEDSFKTKFKRNYKACLNCRTRKVKCDLGNVDNPTSGKCVRCLRERKDCIFVESRRGGSANVVAGKRRRGDDIHGYNDANWDDNGAQYHDINTLPPLDQSDVIVKDEDPESKSKSSNGEFATAQGALVFLAKAAGTIAEADERDRIDARSRHKQIESRQNSHSESESPMLNASSITSNPQHATTNFEPSPVPLSVENSGLTTPESMKRKFYEEPLLPNKRSGESVLPSAPIHPPMKESQFAAFTEPRGNARLTMPPLQSSEFVRPQPSTKLSNIEYIGAHNILTEYEAETLIHLFFSTMHPFFPYIPNALHDPNTLAAYPILLCAILTISSRYHPFDKNENPDTGVPRNIEVHDRLWIYVQRLISQTVWAEASTRSIGTVFAFILFTEWNPRAIHWRWSDYANKPEEDNDKPKDDSENLAGLGAMRRSDRMAWMLIGSAVRLAQDMGFMENNAKTFLATHVVEMNSVMNISRRSMLSHSISEIDVDIEDLEGIKGSKKKRNKKDNYSDSEEEDDTDFSFGGDEQQRNYTEPHLKFTFSQKAKIELLQIMSLGYESLYGYKAQLGGLNQRQNLSVLSILTPLLNNWGKKYRSLLVPINAKTFHNHPIDFNDPNAKLTKELRKSIDRESLIFDYHYAKLYIYSLALSSTTTSAPTKSSKSKRTNLKLDEISKSARFIETAFNSAKEILQVSHRVHKLRMLKYMPVRWVTRIVRAVAFVVKCYLTITAHTSSVSGNLMLNKVNNSVNQFDSTILSLSLISTEEIMQTIQKAAITLREASPDELHLCTRYSNVLMYLCSEMKSKSRNDNLESDEGEVIMRPPKEKIVPTVGARTAVQASPTHVDSGSNPSPTIGQQFEVNTQLLSSNYPQLSANNNGGLNYNTHNNSSSSLNGSIATPTNVSASAAAAQSELLNNDAMMDWFINNNNNIGLDFVEPWTEMIEQQLNSTDFRFDDVM